jgi:hypothetical protein
MGICLIAFTNQILLSSICFLLFSLLRLLAFSFILLGYISLLFCQPLSPPSNDAFTSSPASLFLYFYINMVYLNVNSSSKTFQDSKCWEHKVKDMSHLYNAQTKQVKTLGVLFGILSKYYVEMEVDGQHETMCFTSHMYTFVLCNHIYVLDHKSALCCARPYLKRS